MKFLKLIKQMQISNNICSLDKNVEDFSVIIETILSA